MKLKFNFRSDLKVDTKKYLMLFSFLLSSFWVLFLWGFFEGKGLSAFGFNYSLFLGGVFALFLWQLKIKKGEIKKYLYWIIPLFFIILSFSLYENPFLKSISLFLVFPIGFAIFYNLSFIEKENNIWDYKFISVFLTKIFSFLTEIKKALKMHLKYIFPEKGKKMLVFKKIFLGVLFFLVVAFFVVIPLLSSADALFGQKINFIYSLVDEIISPVLIFKFIFIFILSSVLLAMLLTWSKNLKIVETREKKIKETDPITSGIFIGGISLIYILFLWVQFERLFIGALPFDFKETVYLVKSGFWQLFFLSILNIGIYLAAWKKTNYFVQKMLFVFTFLSLFLLFSAGQRMFLYIKYYGFSYEKFFASYTVLFLFILFFWMLFNFFSKKQKNITKFLATIFLIMYSVLTVLPIEQFIFKTNVYLKNNIKDSKIRLSELRMLSSDVLPIVKEYKKQGILNEITNIPNYKGGFVVSYEIKHWDNWIKTREVRISQKAWYELNLSNIFYLKNNNRK